jgi:ferredoxin
MEKLGEKMNEVGASRLPDFVLRYAGQQDAAIDQVMRSIQDSPRAQFAGGESAQMSKVLALLDAEITQPLKAWARAPHGVPLRTVCQEVAARFEDAATHRDTPLPLAIVDEVRGAIAGLEQALVDAAGVLNTPVLVKEATQNPRYAWERNKGVPRKIGSKLWLYDCINCDKCVPVCPNVANFIYETSAVDVTYDNYELTSDGPPQRVPGGVFKVAKAHQLANYADACNDCGNCDVFCPEDGGPYIEKPRFFGSLETYRQYAGRNGFHIDFEGGQATIYGTIAGATYQLRLSPAVDLAWFEDESAAVEIRHSSGEIVSWNLKPQASSDRYTIDMRPYLQLKLLVESVRNPRHVNFANVGGLL